jgi:predicted small secreted protein
MIMIKRILAFAALAALLSTLYGCNTIQGIGRDIQKAGDKIEDAAKKK